MTKIIKVDENGSFPLKDLEDMVDITKVCSYRLKFNKDRVLTLKLYDKNGRLVKPYVTK